jgi:hypothetical protein
MAFICYGIKNHIRHMANNPDYPLEQVHTATINVSRC